MCRMLNPRSSAFYLGWCFVFFLSVSVFPQKSKLKAGWVFGEVGVVDPAKQVTDRLPFARIELKCDAMTLTIEANDAAIIDEKLPVGRYRLLRVFDKNGAEMELADFQELEFVVKSKKRVRFYVHLRPAKKP